MPTIILENVPLDVYATLQQQAALQQRSLGEELLSLLAQVVPRRENGTIRLPDFVPSEAIPAPCDLPRSSRPVLVQAHSGGRRLPDPWTVESDG